MRTIYVTFTKENCHKKAKRPDHVVTDPDGWVEMAFIGGDYEDAKEFAAKVFGDDWDNVYFQAPDDICPKGCTSKVNEYGEVWPRHQGSGRPLKSVTGFHSVAPKSCGNCLYCMPTFFDDSFYCERPGGPDFSKLMCLPIERVCRRWVSI